MWSQTFGWGGFQKIFESPWKVLKKLEQRLCGGTPPRHTPGGIGINPGLSDTPEGMRLALDAGRSAQAHRRTVPATPARRSIEP